MKKTVTIEVDADFDDLKETKKIIEDIFAEGDVRAEYQYHSSW